MSTTKKEFSEDKAYRLILNAIRNTYQPGEFLLEKNMVASLKMSRTPVAMALSRLVTEGILNKVHKKGCYIPNLNRDDATAAFQARKLLEKSAAKDAAKFSSSKELKDLSKLLDKGERAIEDKNYRLFAETDEAFHHGLVKMGKNEYIYRTWRLVYFRTNIYSRFFDNLYYDTETIVSGKILKMKSPQQHRTIFQALIDKDPIKCKSHVEKHIEHSLQMIFNR